MSEPTTHDILALARRYLPSAHEITAVYQDGTRHVVYEIDGAVVLKLRRPETLPDELVCEAAVLGYLQRTSVPVPTLHGCDVTGGETHHLCLSRVPGAPLTDDQPWPPAVIEDVAKAFAALHALPCEPPVSVPSIEKLDPASWWTPAIDFLQRRELINDAEESALTPRLPEVEESFRQFEPVLLYGDFWRQHCFIQNGRLSGLIDFADAVIGPPGWEFASPWNDGIQGRLIETYCRFAGHDLRTFLPHIEACRLFKAVRTPLWAEQRGIGTRGTRTSLREIRRQLETRRR